MNYYLNLLDGKNNEIYDKTYVIINLRAKLCVRTIQVLPHSLSLAILKNCWFALGWQF